MLIQVALSAVCLMAPVDGPIVAPYSPVGAYGGHWGVDYSAPVGTPVRAPASGVVTFAGSVAGMISVTIEPVSGFKVSVSYLSSHRVSTGQQVTRGMIVGLSGTPHRVPGVHLSTRIGGRYVDPRSRLECRATDISRALRLVTPPAPYPRRRANRHPRRDLRPDPFGPPPCRGDRSLSGRPRSGAIRTRRGALAKRRPSSNRRRTPSGDDPPGDHRHGRV